MQVAVRLRQSDKLGRTTVPPTVSLLRYVYDANAKRARQERLATISFWTDELSQELRSQLTQEELRDWQEFVNDRNRQQERALWRFCLANSVRMLAYASKAVDAGELPASSQHIWSAIDVFTNSLEKAGLAREKRDRGRPRKETLIDSSYLLLRTEEERELWIEREMAQRECGPIEDLPQFESSQPPTPERPKRSLPEYPKYPEGDLIARALKLAFVGAEDAGNNQD